MSFRDRPRSVWAFPLIALALTLAVLGSDWSELASGLRGFLFDTYQRIQPRPDRDTRAVAGFSVKVLETDALSHAELAKLLTDLRAHGAEMAVLVTPLGAPDPQSPKGLVAELPPGPASDPVRAALEAMPSPDKALGESFAKIATVTGFTLGDGGSFVPRSEVAFQGERDPFTRTRKFDNAGGAIVTLARASAGTGAFNVSPDRDGVVRRMPLVFRLKDKPVASLEGAATLVAQNKRLLQFRAADGGALLGGGSGVGSLEAFGRDLPTAPDGSFWIAYARTEPARIESLDQEGDLKHTIVYVATRGDTLTTPFGVRSVASVHAEALTGILLGQVLRRPAAANTAELALLSLLGLASVLVLTRLGVWWAGGFTLVAIAGGAAISWRLFSANGVLLDALGPSLGLLLVFGAGAAARLMEVTAPRAKLHDAFADSLSAASIERIARDPSLLKMDGEMRNVTYLVCGVRGFTGLAASFRDDPVAFTRLLQRVFTPLMDTALMHRGTVERISSEGFSCFWNAPLDDPEHAIHACEAAGGMMEVIARVNEIVTQERRIDGTAIAPVEIGIGISTGPAIVGGFKSHGRTTYSAIGDCAALAARIQALSATYGPAVIVSEDTRKAAERGFAFLEVDFVETGIGTAPVKLYAQLGNPVMRASPKFRALTTFHDHIFQSLRTQQWDKTRELIEQCRKLSGASQKLYDLHLTRIDWYRLHPPGSDWDGAFRQVLS